MRTAVEWLEKQIKDYSLIKPSLINGFNILFEQAKEMEKQQIIDANNRGYKVGRKDIQESAQDYYNETYKTK